MEPTSIWEYRQNDDDAENYLIKIYTTGGVVVGFVYLPVPLLLCYLLMISLSVEKFCVCCTPCVHVSFQSALYYVFANTRITVVFKSYLIHLYNVILSLDYFAVLSDCLHGFPSFSCEFYSFWVSCLKLLEFWFL